MAKSKTPSFGPKIRSTRDFQSRLIHRLECINENLRQLKAATAAMSDSIQVACLNFEASPEDGHRARKAEEADGEG